MSTHASPDRFFEHAGARLRWRLEGHGPAIVLLHGWALDLDYWDEAVRRLAARFTLLRFDRRGFGLSQGEPDAARDLTDLVALLDASGLQRALVIGMSQGARLALHFAAAWPARVQALVLDGAPLLDAEPELPLAQFRRALEHDGLAALHAGIRRHPLMQLRREDPGPRRRIDTMLARYRGLDLQSRAEPQQRPIAGTDALRVGEPLSLHTIDMPVLVLNGEGDSAGRRLAAASLAAALPDARRVQLADAGHLALLDTPGAYVQAVTAFAQSLPAW